MKRNKPLHSKNLDARQSLGRSRRTRTSWLGAGTLTMLSLLARPICATVQFRLASFEVGPPDSTLYVSTYSTATLSMDIGNDIFKSNECFELVMPNPYASFEHYSPFNADGANISTCSTSDPNFQVTCEVINNFESARMNHLKFFFTAVGTATKLDLYIQNFYLPYSGHTIESLDLYSYDTQECTMLGIGASPTLEQVSANSIQIMPSAFQQASIESSSNIVASQGNNFMFKFTLGTVLDLAGSGAFKITVAPWYSTNSGTVSSFSGVGTIICSVNDAGLTIGQITYSSADRELFVRYSGTSSATDFILTCEDYFNNPIRREKMSGWKIATVADTIDGWELINESDVIFDGTVLEPATISSTDFIIDPDEEIVSVDSAWFFEYENLRLPLESGKCYWKLILPPELVLTFNNNQGLQTYNMFSPHPTRSSTVLPQTGYFTSYENEQRTVSWQGCGGPGLGGTPKGSFYLENVKTPSQVSQTSAFQLFIYSDANMKESTLIGKMEGSNISASQLKEGAMIGLDIRPDNYDVQSMTSYTVSFTTSTDFNIGEFGGKILIDMPVDLTLQTDFTASSGDVDIESVESFPVNKQIEITLKDKLASQSEEDKIIKGGTEIAIKLGTEDKSAAKNQNSKKDAGSWQIVTMNNYNSGQYGNVDKGNSQTSFTAMTGQISSLRDIAVSNDVTYGTKSRYTFEFSCEHEIQKDGIIRLKIPAQMSIDTNEAAPSGSCNNGQYECKFSALNQIDFILDNKVGAEEAITLEVYGIRNPRTTETSEAFTIDTFDDSSAQYQIDSGEIGTVTMTQMGTLDNFQVSPGNYTCGVENDYVISFNSGQIPIIDGDTIQLDLPEEVQVPSTNNQKCGGRDQIFSATCQYFGQTVYATLDVRSNEAVGAFSFTVTLQNPPTTQQSSVFSNIKIKHRDADVAYFPNSVQGVTNTDPYYISKNQVTLEQTSTDSAADAEYTFTVRPVNNIPAGGSIRLSWPLQVSLVDQDKTICQVKLSQSWKNPTCDISATDIIIKDAFPNGFKENEFSIKISDFKNPLKNQNLGNFGITIFADSEQQYRMEVLPSSNQIIESDLLLHPKLKCDYPCKTCQGSDDNERNFCTSCYSQEDGESLLYLMPKLGKCQAACSDGYSFNGKENLVCEPCGTGCKTCEDDNKDRCITCLDDFPLFFGKDATCWAAPKDGTFKAGDKILQECSEDCATCIDNAEQCTSCKEESTKPVLFGSQCQDKCDDTYTAVGGVCTACESPCANCADAVDYCTSCDGVDGLKFVFSGNCFVDCPVGTSPNTIDNSNLFCTGCLAGCALCDSLNPASCLRCDEGLYVSAGECVAACPEGYKLNYEMTACEDISIYDLGIIYFPFMIATLIMVLIVLFGLLKKKPMRLKGKMQKVSTQRTITCILVMIAPLQFLATITQWILAYFFGTWIHAGLAALVTLIMFILNIIFQINYGKKFNSKSLPKDKFELYQKKKLTPAQTAKYIKVSDKEFGDYTKKHRCPNLAISTMTLIFSYKFNKLYYSHFYMYGAFKANWTDEKYYRKMQTWYSIVHMITVDLFLICIDVTGIINGEWGNQLYITQVETLALSLLSIGLGSYELYKLKDYLSYNGSNRAKVSSGYDDDDMLDKDSREQMLKDLLKKVKGNKDTFLNNKLDELLQDFGDRRCKSCVVLGTGWDKEEDPRKIRTWHLTPKAKKIYGAMDIHWTIDDMIGNFDNVYADAHDKNAGVESGVQGDMEQNEFENALNRNRGDVLQPIDEADEHAHRKKGKRRGRKNKYYTQIDHEDDEEADAVNSEEEREAQLAIVKEQEEEEEAMRKQVENDRLAREKAGAEAKRKREEEERIRLEQEAAEELARQKRQRKEDEERLKQEKAEEAKRRAQQKERERLEKSAEKERQQREAEKKRLAAEAAAKSAAERKAYEDAEAKRAKELEEEKARLHAEKLAQEQKELLMSKQEKEQQRLEQERLQREKDEADLRAKQAQLAEDEKVRQEAKDVKSKAEKDRQAQLEKQKAEKEAYEREQARLKKLQIEEEDRLRREAEEMARQKRLAEEEAARNTSIVEVNEDALKDFQQQAPAIQAPPSAEARTFNENDILGELDRDEKGNLLLLQDKDGNTQDKQGQPVNPRGYLTDHKGDVIENQDSKVMFPKADLDERGEIPAPFCVEKHNFNPHDLQGDFEYVNDKNGQPQRQIMKSSQGFYVDKKGRRVNKFGWLVNPNGHFVDKWGRKKFDRKQMQSDGDMPKLYNYIGRRYDIQDLMGCFDKDSIGSIMPIKSRDGTYLVDNIGRRVNDKGYLIDEEGNIIDKEGKQIFSARHLQNGEFPKIFPFTKFNVQSIQGDFEMDPLGNPILDQNANGQLVDRRNRVVNQRGYLIDKKGNIITKRGSKMFDREILDADGEIPKVFRLGLLRADTGSSLSRLMSEIEKNNPSDYERADKNMQNQMYDEMARGDHGDTSVDSMMEETPANYNIQNQRYDEEDFNAIPEEARGQQQYYYDQQEGDLDARRRIKKKKLKRKKKAAVIEFLPPTKREVVMADAYGGIARGQIRRPGVKYDKERLKNRIQTPAEYPGGRQQLEDLANSLSGFNRAGVPETAHKNAEIVQMRGTAENFARPAKNRNNYMAGLTGQKSNMGGSDAGSQFMPPVPGSRGQERGKSPGQQRPKKKNKAHMKDGDFEKMFGKDIDEFLENSDWDIESFDKMSQFSHGTHKSGANKLKDIEKVYLQRLEQGSASASRAPGSRKASKSKQRQAPKFREFQDRFVDDPGYVHKGNELEFKTSAGAGGDSSKKHKMGRDDSTRQFSMGLGDKNYNETSVHQRR